MLSLEKSVQELINDGKGDIGRLEHILSTLKKGHSLYTSDQEYLEKLLAESRKTNEVMQSKEASKLTELEDKERENKSKDTTKQSTEIELLRKEIHELQDRNHVIEESLKKQLKQKKHGRGTTIAISIAGSILLAIGLGFNGAGSAMISRGSYPSGYGYANDSGGGLVMFVIGLVFIILGVRIIAKA